MMLGIPSAADAKPNQDKPPWTASYSETKNTDGTTSVTYTSDPIPVSKKQPKNPRPSHADIKAAVAKGSMPNGGLMQTNAGWYGPWGPGCYWTYTYWADKNVWGTILRESWQIVNNWCFDGRTIYSTPWARYQSAGHWGWTDCGWANGWQGWIRYTQEWAVGGTALFGFGKCGYSGWPHPQTIHVYENGWRYTS